MVASQPGSEPGPPASGKPTDEVASEADEFVHDPVMCDEIVALAAPVPSGTFLDATVGGAGHAAALLDAHPHLDILGIDRDPVAVMTSTERLARFAGRYRIERLRFDEFDQLGSIPLSGFLFDLGVSSPQLDLGARGFSFRNDGPLDMRMDPDMPLSAFEVVNNYDERELAALIRRYADEKFAGRIAASIVARRPLASTSELAEAVVAAIPAPARRTGGHPAKRTFQAIRIEVNDELNILAPALESALDALSEGGRGMVLTYHSGEDRIVKSVFRNRTAVEQPPGLPVEAPTPDYRIVRPMARRPSDDEVATNRRSASARLRTIERRAA